MFMCVVEVQLTGGPLSFQLLPSSTISQSLLILLLNPSPSDAVIHLEEKMLEKHAPSRSRTAMRGRPSCLLTMSAFDRLVTLAPRLARERC